MQASPVNTIATDREGVIVATDRAAYLAAESLKNSGPSVASIMPSRPAFYSA
jgi:hypothetical protein